MKPKTRQRGSVKAAGGLIGGAIKKLCKTLISCLCPQEKGDAVKQKNATL